MVMDWLTALAEVEQAAVRYQKARLADEAYTLDDRKEHRRLEDARYDALGALANAAMLLPLDGTEIS
jgi:hypothetical protein